MNRPGLPARRAEEFARILEGQRPEDADEVFEPLLRTVTLLREQPRPVPRPEFVADLRQRLMTAADEALLTTSGAREEAGRAARAVRPRKAERRLGAVVAAAVLVGSTTGLAYAAEGSLPGSPLYPVKRGIEHVEVAMNNGQAARGNELLDQASTRLQEAASLLEGQHDADTDALVRATLAEFTASAAQGSDLLFSSYQSQGDAADIAGVRDFTSGNVGTLERLAQTSPHSLAPSFDSAAATLSDIDQQALVLCQGCSNRPPVTLPSSLVDLSSMKSLSSLVVGPLVHGGQTVPNAARGRREAQAAETAAQHLREKEAAAAGTNAQGEQAGASTSAGDQPDLPVTVTPIDPDHPVSGLVSSVTGLVPGSGSVDTKKLTIPLDQTLKGVTDGLQQGLSGLTGSLLDPGNKSGTDKSSDSGSSGSLLP